VIRTIARRRARIAAVLLPAAVLGGALTFNAVRAQQASAGSCWVITGSRVAYREPGSTDKYTPGYAYIANGCAHSIKVKVDVEGGYDTGCATIASYSSHKYGFLPYPWVYSASARGAKYC
jgi:hypothetical protein